MSSTALVIMRKGKPHQEIEFANSWGGVNRIWDAMFEYIKDPSREYHTWLTDGTNWFEKMVNVPKPEFEQAVLLWTADGAYVKRKHFKRMAKDLRQFMIVYPVTTGAYHLPAWADILATLDADAVGIYGTSVGNNWWIRYDEKKDKMIYIQPSKGFSVYNVAEIDSRIKPPKQEAGEGT